MSERRILEDDEKRLIEKNLKSIHEEIEYQQYLSEYNSIMVSRGLKANYMLKLREHRMKLRDANERLTSLRKQVLILDDQLKNGVKAKEE